MGRSYIRNIDSMIEETSLSDVLTHYGQRLPENNMGEHRLPCPFDTKCVDSSYGQLAVNQNSSAKLIYCHSCGVRGNLLTLIHGLETGQPPAGGKVKGDEFKHAVRIMQEIRGGTAHPSPAHSPAPTPAIAADEPRPVRVNPPLKSNEKTKPLVDLYEDFITDPAEMSPNAARYFRERQWLTPELAAKWRMGYIPKNGRSLFKGWITYAQHNMAGEVISYSGRSPAYEEKYEQWVRASRDPDKRPMKHKYVKGYERGLELYGQMASRLEEPAIAESLQERGLIVVEGANDVIRLDALDVAAVGLCSNKVTDEQVEKLVLFAQRNSQGRIALMPDNDDEGQQGFETLSLKLLQRGMTLRMVWPRLGEFDGLDPADITDDQWRQLDAALHQPV